jgi:hypothetical protein
MLFAIWTENRATEDGDRSSLHSQHVEGGIHSLSRPNSVIMPTPPVQLAEVEDDATTMKKLEANEEQFEPGFEDRRPAVFKSTFWEVMCVTSLVCGQLTNVLFLYFCANSRNWLMPNKSLFRP